MYIAKRDKGSMDSVRTSFDAPRISEDLQFCDWRHFWLADVGRFFPFSMFRTQVFLPR